MGLARHADDKSALQHISVMSLSRVIDVGTSYYPSCHKTKKVERGLSGFPHITLTSGTTPYFNHHKYHLTVLQGVLEITLSSN